MSLPSNKYLNQAQHNLDFFKRIHEDYPHDFADWKITILFYSCLHYLNAYYFSLGESIETSHAAMFDMLHDSDIPIPRNVRSAYSSLFNNCRASRYNGFTDINNFSIINDDNLNNSKRFFKTIKDFVDSKF